MKRRGILWRARSVEGEGGPSLCAQSGQEVPSARRNFPLILSLKAYTLLILYTLYHVTPDPRADAAFIHQAPGEFRSTRVVEIRDSFWQRLTPFDGQWYQDIAVRGYRKLAKIEQADGAVPPGNFAFFPLLPGLLRLARAVAPEHYVALTILVVAYASAVGAWVVSLLARRVGAPPALAVVLLLAFPTAVFQCLLYTEGLFLLISALALHFTLGRRLGGAVICGVLGGLCRPQGVLLAVPIAFEFVLVRLREGERDRKAIAMGAVGALAPLSGFLVMALVSHAVADSPTAFLEIQGRWGRSYETGGLLSALSGVVGYGGPPFDVIGVLFGIVLLPMIWRRLPMSLAAYATATVVLPLLTGSILSMGRFVSVSIPHFLCLGMLLADRSLLRNVAVAGMIIVQVLLAKGVVSWYFVG